MVNQPDRIDFLAQQIATNHAETVERLARLETALSGLPTRVSRLERRAHVQSGIVATLSAVFSAVVTYLKFSKG